VNTTAPEPGSMLLFATGLGVIAVCRHRARLHRR
jgi:PEP-CTERM motif